MKKRYIVGIVVIVLVVLAVFLVSKKSAIAPESSDVLNTEGATTTVSVLSPVKTGTKTTAPVVLQMTKKGAYIVSYLNSGFTPVTITIKRGKAVHFVNNSAKAMSIMAVDQNSQVYRELNQEQSVARGGFYDFTFNTAGTWYYTNRNNRLDRGTIIVE